MQNKTNLNRTLEEAMTFSTLLSHFDDTKAFLNDLALREPRIAQFCRAATSSIHSVSVDLDLPSLREESYDSHEILDILLISAQTIATIPYDDPAENEFEEADHVRRHIDMAIKIEKALRMSRLLELVGKFTMSMRDCKKPAPCIWRFVPFLNRYVDFVDEFLFRFAIWTKALFKLVYVSGSVIRRIATEGFCRPPDQSEDGGKGEGELEASDGVGLGEGSGKENVSNQIEDESQYEGMQDQKTDDDAQQQQEQEQETGDDLEVDFDLDGGLEDGPDDGKDEDDEQESLGDLDEEFGQDIDEPEESNNVDEEFWNDEQKEADGEDSEKPAKKTDGDAEVVGKDGRDEQRIEGEEQGEEAKDDDTNAKVDEDPSEGPGAEEEHRDYPEPAKEDSEAQQEGGEEITNDIHDVEDPENIEEDEVDDGLSVDREGEEGERQDEDVEMEDSNEVQGMVEEIEAEIEDQADPSGVRADIQPGTFDDSADAGMDSTSAPTQEVNSAAENEATNEAQDVAESKTSGPQQEQ